MSAIKRSGLSQNGVSRAIGVDSSNINKMCAGTQTIPIYVAVRLEAVLDMTAESLLVTQLYDQIRDTRDNERQGKIAVNRHWTPEEDDIVMGGGSLDELSEKLGRSRMSVAQRRRRLNEMTAPR